MSTIGEKFMSLQLKIVEDWKLALKAKDPRKESLSMIITELKNKAIKENLMGDQGRMVSDELAIDVLQKMAKQRKEAITAYQDANRADLVQKEQQELLVIQNYLPMPITDDELSDLVKQVIIQVQASSKKDMGKVIAAVIKAVQGRADGKRIQTMVQELLV
jgi:uncharacterized protein YqeY